MAPKQPRNDPGMIGFERRALPVLAVHRRAQTERALE